MKRNLSRLCLVLDQVPHRVQTAVHRAALFVGGAEVVPLGFFLIVGDMDGVLDKLVNALVFRGGYRHDGHAEHRFQCIDIDRAAVRGQLIHDIERHHHRNIHLQQLHGEVEVALDVRRVDDIDDRPRLFVKHKAAGDDLLTGVGRHGIDAGQVGDERVFVSLDDAVLAVDRHAGKVADVLIGARQLIEQRCFAAVLISDQRVGERRVVR